MDIEYLLFLQDFRNGINDALTPFMEGVSLFAVTMLSAIPVFLYWCADRRRGLYTLAAYCASGAMNALVKLTACVYRPWIRDARILPAGEAIKTATGYSFPSGHTITAASVYGGLGMAYITFKSYPANYDAAGNLIVDPKRMMDDGYYDIGKLIGFCIGRFIEKKWVKFKSAGLSVKGILISLLGLVPLFFHATYGRPALRAALGGHFGMLVFSITGYIYIIALYPLVIKMLQEK